MKISQIEQYIYQKLLENNEITQHKDNKENAKMQN